MIRSMTGFGRAAFSVAGVGFEVEARSVNHRYLDARIRLPRVLADREADVKAQVHQKLARGKVDLNVSVSGTGGAATRLEIDLETASQYVDAARDLAGRHEVSPQMDATALLSLPGVTQFVDTDLPSADLHSGLAEAVDAALGHLGRMRGMEGEALNAEFRTRLDRVTELVASCEGRSGEVQRAVRERLRRRAEQLRQEAGMLDEARLHQEIVIAADKLDIAEEVARLRSHIDQFINILDTGGADAPVGRRLDFLLQELGREANTIGSKASDAPIAHDVVELKAELERIREQVQNVE